MGKKSSYIKKMKPLIKIYKIITALWLALLVLGFIFPTNIRQNIIFLYQEISSNGDIGFQVGITIVFTSVVIFWFAPKTLWKLISTKGKIRNFWNDL